MNPLKTNAFEGFWWVLVGIVLVGLRWYGYGSIGLVNYDSAYHFIIAQEIAEGRFEQIFQHAAPHVHVSNGLVYLLFQSVDALKWFHLCIQVLALGLLFRAFARFYQWHLFFGLAGFMVCGSSMYHVYAARYVSLEPLTLLFVVLLVNECWLSTRNISHRRLFVYFLLGLGVNYKFLPTVMPVGLMVLWSQQNFNFSKQNLKALMQFGLVLGCFFGFWMVLGTFLGKAWYVYPASIYVHAVERNIHPALLVPHWSSDWGFYFHFLWDFESPVILFGLWVMLLFSIYPLISKPSPLVLFCLLFFVGMNVVQKAPRGIGPILPLVYGILFQFLNQKTSWKVYTPILSILMVYNLWSLKTFVWKYDQTSYPKVAQTLKSQGINHFSSTSSCLLAPFVPSKSIVILHDMNQRNQDISTDRILDGYCALGGIPEMMSPQWDEKVVGSWVEPTLSCPILWLEAAEYNGWNYATAIKLWKSNAEVKILWVKKENKGFPTAMLTTGSKQ